MLARQSGPTVVAAHSYGGQVITSPGTDAPNVVGLVYIAAFGVDEGESIGALLQQGPDPGGGERRCRLGGLRMDPRRFESYVAHRIGLRPSVRRCPSFGRAGLSWPRGVDERCIVADCDQMLDARQVLAEEQSRGQLAAGACAGLLED